MNVASALGTRRTEIRLLGFLSLFSSLGTLVCCALPSLLVLLGLGATVASILSSVPWLVALSRHKPIVFTVSGVLIAANFIYVYCLAPRLKITQSTGEACPVDQPSACAPASRLSKVLLWISAGIYVVGFFTAFVLGLILTRFFS